MPLHADLVSLQDLDLAIDEHRVALRQVDLRLAEDPATHEARLAVQQTERRLRDLDTRQREAERLLEDIETRVTREEGRLYGGTVVNSRELTALQDEVGSLKREQRTREEAVLAIMAQTEEVGAAHAQALRKLRGVEADRANEVAHLRERHARLEAEIADLEDRVLQVRERIPADVLDLYQKLRERRHGRGVARVERGSCGGCRIALPSNMVTKIRGDALIQCPTCERILCGV